MSCQNFGMSLEDPDMDDDYPYVPGIPGIGAGARCMGGINNHRANFTVGSPPTGSPDENLYEGRKIRLGVCAMAKKVKSKPMHEILKRLSYFAFLEIVIFEEEVILESEVEDWPVVDCLICFHSAGFPLDKAVLYDKLRHPYTINNLQMQYDLMDRRSVHDILTQQGIDQPKYAIIDRDKNSPTQNELIEHEDHIEVNGVVFHKPFVEKPISAEDHNVYIYFPSAAGGGSQRLFRKIGSRSSVYSPVSRVRTTGSYVYEEFMPTDGTDVKVYTVGADYAHAEARKAPALDGKVERDPNGKEVRYPVILTAKEKMIARKVCMAFQQNVCGFDLLRANGVSYVCDVNGFSFVKTSSKYYDDCATVLGSMILRELAPQLSMRVPPELASLEVLPIVPTTYGTMMELRCVIAVIRHGDRTPKQKMKMEVKHQLFFDLFTKYDGYKTGQLKLKRPTQLQEVLDIARHLLDEVDSSSAPPELEEKRNKLIQLRFVLEMYGHFSGINRKIQLKYQPQGFVSASSADESERDPSLVLILKWGGELTPAGKTQAEELGKAFRCMYPTYGETPGLGLLRLHSTYRHDLKIYASDEGRVQMTAAAFAKGFLALEGELTPILVQMVKSGTHTNGLLDNADEAQPLQTQAKQTLQEVLNKNTDFSETEINRINPHKCIAIDKACSTIKNSFTTLEEIFDCIGILLAKLKPLKADQKIYEKLLYHGESLELMWRRWWKLEKDFKQKNGNFDVSKIPDIYDNIKYDLQHNSSILETSVAERLYILSKALADIVIPQEYGMTTSEKVKIGANIAKPLLRKIKADLLTNAQESEDYTRLDSRYMTSDCSDWFSMGVTSPDRHVRTRLYFTSESHIHSLLSLINHGGLVDKCDDQWCRAQEYLSGVSELNYISQIVIMMYEDPTKEKNSEERFHIEIHFSPGAYGVNVPTSTQAHDRNTSNGRGYRPNKGRSHVNPVKVPTGSNVDSDEDLQFSSAEQVRKSSGEVNSAVGDLIPEIDFTCDILPEEPSEEGLLENGTDGTGQESSPHHNSTPIHVRQQRTNAGGKRHHSIAGGMQHCSPTGSALISTKVISGSHSAPNLHDINENRALEAYGMAVPEIMPLETLHNSLTLAHFDKFLTNIISMGNLSPKRSYSAMPVSLVGSLAAAVYAGYSCSKPYFPTKSRPKLPDTSSNQDRAIKQQSACKTPDPYESTFWLTRHQSMAVQTTVDSDLTWSIENMESFISPNNSDPMATLSSTLPINVTSTTNQLICPSGPEKESHQAAKPVARPSGTLHASLVSKSQVPNKEKLGKLSVDTDKRTLSGTSEKSVQVTTDTSRLSHEHQDQQNSMQKLSAKSGQCNSQSQSFSSDHPEKSSSDHPENKPCHSSVPKDHLAVRNLAVGPTTELTHSVSTPTLQEQTLPSLKLNEQNFKSASTEAVYSTSAVTSGLRSGAAGSRSGTDDPIPGTKSHSSSNS